MDNPSSDKIVSTDNVSYSQAGGTFLPSGINGPDTTAIAVSTVVGRDRAHSRNAAERGKGIIVRAPGKPAPPDEATRPAPPPPGVGRTVDLQTGRNLRLRITKVIRGNVSAPSCLDIDVPDGVALGHLTDNPSYPPVIGVGEQLLVLWAPVDGMTTVAAVLPVSSDGTTYSSPGGSQRFPVSTLHS